MSSKVVSPKSEVETFLKQIKEILVNPNFNVSRDMDILLKKRSENAIDPYTTGNTLLALDFDKADVVIS